MPGVPGLAHSPPVRHAIGGVFALLLMLAAMVSPAWAEELKFPALAGRVTDAAEIIPADVEARLTEKLAKLEASSGAQFVVVTVPSLQGREISDYGLQLGNHWGVGREAHDDGLLLIVAPNERKVRIEVGNGLTTVVTDPDAARIIDQVIVPRFQGGDLPRGIEAGADALIQELATPPAAAQAQPSASPSAAASPGAAAPAEALGGNALLYGGLGGGLVVIVLLVWFVRARDGRA